MPERVIVDALRPVEKKTSDFSRTTLFGSMGLDKLPTGDFFVGEPLIIKDQDYQVQGTDFCGGYAGSSVSEDQEMVELNGEFLFMAAKRLAGGEEWRKWGTDLREICEAACKVGCIEQQYYPFENRTELTRDFIANPANWPEDLDMLAAEHRKNSYTDVDGPHDTFNNFRMQMYMARAARKSILTGVKWRRSWTQAAGGIIDDRDYSDEPGFGHAVKCFGQMLLYKETDQPRLYLVFQLSNDNQIGDQGLFYLPQSVVNKEFSYGSYMFEDMPAEYLRYHHENGLRVDANPFTKLLTVILNWIKSL